MPHDNEVDTRISGTGTTTFSMTIWYFPAYRNYNRGSIHLDLHYC